MARKSYIGKAEARRKAIVEIGFEPWKPGDDFSFNRHPPGDLLAFLWRSYSTLREALAFWGEERPDLPAGVTDPVAELRAMHAELGRIADEEDAFRESARQRGREAYTPEHLKKLEDFDTRRDAIKKRGYQVLRHWTGGTRSEASSVIRTALGGPTPDYVGATSALEEWIQAALADMGMKRFVQGFHEDPRNAVGNELFGVVKPLIVAYQDPRRFFCDLLPKREMGFLTEERLRGDHWLGINADGSPSVPFEPLAEALHRWGYGLLLNPAVRAAFDDAAAEPTFSTVLALAEGRGKRPNAGGRPSTANWLELRKEFDRLPARKKAEWRETTAARLGIEPGSLERKLRPSALKGRTKLRA